jgi:hypothetical protein
LLLIAAIEDLEQYLYNTAEQGDPAVTSLAQYSILPTYSGPMTSGAFFFLKRMTAFETFFLKKRQNSEAVILGIFHLEEKTTSDLCKMDKYICY